MTPDELHARLFISASEAAEVLGVDPRTISRAIDDGVIPGIRLGRTVRIPVPRFLEACMLTGPQNSEADPATGPAIATTNIRPLQAGSHLHDAAG